ncbi:MAG: hypothetical protein J6Q40_06170 [Tidjanibacter sp.]|nr:hypothetical protein [Tidjanibacter sp.]
MKRVVFTLVLLLGSALSLTAQTDYSKMIEVTREYTPTVERAQKLSIAPTAVDTVALRPEARYQITPTPWSTPFSVGKLDHAQLSAARWRNPGMGYLRVGGGWPVSSEADVYLTPLRSRSSTLGFYLNHQGFEDKIKNDMGVRANALSLENSVGLWFESKLSERVDLQVDANYSLDIFTPYGGISTLGEDMSWDGRVRYNDAGVALSLGNDSKELAGVNFRIGGSLNLFGAKDVDNHSFGQRDYSVWGRLGYSREGHSVGVDVRAEGRKGAKELSEYDDFRVILSPSYEFVTERNFLLRLGVSYIYNSSPEGKKIYLLPMADVAYKRFYGFVPYLRVGGDLSDGSYRAQRLMNPYVAGGSWVNNGARLGGRVGANGDLDGVVNYDIFGGYDIYRLYNYSVAVNASSRFMAVARPLNVLYYGANVVLHFGPSLALRGAVRMNDPIAKSFDNESLSALYAGVGIRTMEGDVALQYQYKSKWNVSLGVRMLGEAHSAINIGSIRVSESTGIDKPIVTEDNYVAVTIPSATDLYLNVEYSPKSNFALYLSGGNLLGQQIYDFAFYPLPGVNIKAGVKVNF